MEGPLSGKVSKGISSTGSSMGMSLDSVVREPTALQIRRTDLDGLGEKSVCSIQPSEDVASMGTQPHRPFANVLAVIPDPDMRTNVLEMMGESGIQVISVSNFHEAREVLRRKRFSLLICSARLQDGTFHELLSISPRPFAGMVILCSGSCPSGTRIDALELGILDYVSCPLPREELQWVIQGALAKSLNGDAISTENNVSLI